MAVAVKKNREAPSTRLFDRLSVAIVAGVLYIVVGLGVLFPLMDYVWWHLLNLDRGVLGWWLLLILADLGLATGLVVVGKRLLDAHPIKGLRPGIALGVLAVFLIALLTDWVGGYVADYVFANGMSPTVGAAITVAFGVAVLVLAGYYYLTPKAEEALAALAEQGWLSSASYKRAQGVRVRRGTILGILILAGCGIWAVHQGLSKQGGNWQVGIPFTGQVAITEQTRGDDRELQVKLKEMQAPLTEEWEQRRREALETLRQVGHFPPDVKDQLSDLAKGNEDVEKLLHEVVHPGAEEGERVLGSEDQQKVEAALRTLRQPMPSAVLLVDLFWLRDHNREVAGDPAKKIPGKYVKIVNPGDDPYQTEKYAPKDGAKYELKTGPNFERGEVVSSEAFDKQSRLRQQKYEQLKEHPGDIDPELVVPPTSEPIQPARTEPVEYKSLVLLPHVAYTLPVILAALTLWFAWRCVNVPAFADFLIATEAELNKVSWTTRRRLIQDTVVVLTTVILMAVALFAADVVWYRLLRGIGVLQPPPADTSKAQEQQPW